MVEWHELERDRELVDALKLGTKVLQALSDAAGRHRDAHLDRYLVVDISKTPVEERSFYDPANAQAYAESLPEGVRALSIQPWIVAPKNVFYA